MSARDRLREYLEQRRDMGESELVLDGLPLEEVMRLLGVRGDLTAGAEPAEAPARRSTPPSEPVDEAPGEAPDWRSALRAIGAEAPQAQVPRASTSAGIAPGGLIVGARDTVLEPAVASLDSLEAVAASIAACRRCGLHEGARNPVPGEGNPHAGFVCVGEAPGATEDETGRPFVGRAGELLTKIIAAVGFAREDVFICNVLKHRPPGNRNPAADEILACSPYLLRQLALLQPRVILALGTFAAQTLLQTTQPVGKLRGQVHRYHGVPLIVTYHPAALLRNPSWKRPTWEDVQLARRIFDNAAAG